MTRKNIPVKVTTMFLADHARDIAEKLAPKKRQPVTGARCPRCGDTFDPARGATSRSDNLTDVCGPCGKDEALVWHEQPAQRGVLPTWIDGSANRVLH